MSADATRFCGTCGAPRDVGSTRFCRRCGAPFAPTTEVPDAVASGLAGARARPEVVASLLAWLGSGAYAFWWLWMSWREIKRIRGDSSMRPFWHAVSAFLVPIYGLFRVHEHFRALDDLCEEAGVTTRSGPWLMTVVYVLLFAVLSSSIVLGAGAAGAQSAAPLAPVSLLIVSAAFAHVIGWGQGALNAYYGASVDPVVPKRVHAFEVAFLVVFALSFAAQMYTAFSRGP